jgi:hypothetical protein
MMVTFAIRPRSTISRVSPDLMVISSSIVGPASFPSSAGFSRM